ncbi:MAG: S8 family serine peptidase [candidate division WOR-3 bacterium]|nr:S8 family serine peptidase [candidate division WOR-3 bacterium]MDW8151194.1 S8 family serine peptidase [candidate division WOR-3 bacterium]
MLLVLFKIIDNELEEKLRTLHKDSFIDILIVLKEQKLLSNIKNPKFNVEYLKANHLSSQGPVMNFLKSLDIKNLKQFWVINAIYAKIKVSNVESLKSRGEIERIYYARDNFFIVSDIKEGNRILLDTPTYGIKLIKADSVWIKYNIKGRGVILGSIDTGVDTSHPALKGKILSYWLDAVNYQKYPYDDHNHGTHTIGTMVADSNVGVAPEAKVIACKAFNKYGRGSAFSILDCIQFFTELKAEYGLDIRIINNSWGTLGNNTWLWNAIWNGWRANGIIPIFSAGNSGPNLNTILSPADYPHVIAVGAVDWNDTATTFSSRGPAPSSPPYNDNSFWSRIDWNYIKPDIMAPGRMVYSTIRNGSYAYGNGTSMASPHVAGAIALMLEKNPNLEYYQIYQILTDIANDKNCNQADWPNNHCGWGRINVLKAIENINQGNSPFLVYIDRFIYDKNQNGKIEDFETVYVDIKIRNSGYDTLKNVYAKLYTNSNLVNILDDSIFFGDLAPQTEINAFSRSDSFKFMANNIDDGDSVVFTINIVNKNYKFKIFLGEIPIGTATIDTTISSFSFSSNGEFKEFKFPKDSANLLTFGSIAFGNSVNYLKDNFYNSRDLYSTWGIYRSYYFPGECYSFVSTDGNIEVKGIFYGLENDSITHLKYRIKNISNNLINNLLFGLFVDFDIKSPSNDFGWSIKCSPSYGGIVFKSDDYNYYIGLFLSNGVYKTSRIFPNNIQFSKANKFMILDGILGDSINLSPNNYSISVSAGPYFINPNDSIMLDFILLASLDTIKCKFTNLVQNEIFKFDYKNRNIILNLEKETDFEYIIYKLDGRIVNSYSAKLKKGSYSFKLNAKKGIYILDMKLFGKRQRLKIILF